MSIEKFQELSTEDQVYIVENVIPYMMTIQNKVLIKIIFLKKDNLWLRSHHDLNNNKKVIRIEASLSKESLIQDDFIVDVLHIKEQVKKGQKPLKSTQQKSNLLNEKITIYKN